MRTGLIIEFAVVAKRLIASSMNVIRCCFTDAALGHRDAVLTKIPINCFTTNTTITVICFFFLERDVTHDTCTNHRRWKVVFYRIYLNRILVIHRTRWRITARHEPGNANGRNAKVSRRGISWHGSNHDGEGQLVFVVQTISIFINKNNQVNLVIGYFVDLIKLYSNILIIVMTAYTI